jgi:cell division septation protein DedD
MKRNWVAWTLGGALLVATPALADTKAGVDAWQQGDYARAIAEWRPLAEQGDADAQFNLGQAYKMGRGVQADLQQSADWYRRAAQQGHLRAEDNLGLVLFQLGDRTNALPYLQRASSRGEPRAQYIVGTALFNGDLLAKDWVRAYALMTRAAAAGLPQATTSLQQMDKFVPDDQRQQGLAMAAALEKQQGDPALAAATPLPARTVTRDSAVRTTEIPASTPPVTERPAYVPPRVAVRPDPVVPQPVAKQPVIAPKPKPTPPAPVPARAASGDWRVQLGAFSDEARAKALWSSLSGRVRALGGLQPYLQKDGGITRLQAGPIASSAYAGRICGAVKSAGADCIPRRK